MADPVASLEVSAQEWLDADRRDRDGMVAKYLRGLADEVENLERITVPRRTGLTFESIHVDEVEDADGFLEEHVASRNPQSNVLDAKNGFVYNRHKKGRPKGSSGVREVHPFMREALLTVTKVGL